jgi:hypothetical protein
LDPLIVRGALLIGHSVWGTPPPRSPYYLFSTNELYPSQNAAAIIFDPVFHFWKHKKNCLLSHIFLFPFFEMKIFGPTGPFCEHFVN